MKLPTSHCSEKMQQNSVIKLVLIALICIHNSNNNISNSVNAADVVEGAQYTNDDTLFHLEAANLFDAPLIYPTTSEVTLEVNTNYTLRCEASQPITWLQDSQGYQLSSFLLSYAVAEDPKRPFVALLTFPSVSHYDVGRYYCMKNSTAPQDENVDFNFEEAVEEFAAARTYIYVNDVNNPMMETHLRTIHGIQYDNIIIPCRPTSKSVELELVKADDEQRLLEFEYDPTIGFTIGLSAIHDSGDYICRVKGFEDITQEFEVLVSEHYSLVQARTEYIEKPKIVAVTGAHATVGDDIRLACSVDIQAGLLFTMEWLLPNKMIASNTSHTAISITSRMRNIQKPGLEIATTNLTVYSAQNGTDNGSYRCLVRDHLGHTSSSNKFISVIPVGAGFIKLREDSGKYESEVVKGKTVAQFVATYLAAPEAVYEWYNNKGDLITEVNDKYELRKTDHQLHLRIKNPDLSDAGRYTLIGENGFDKKTLHFELKVKDKPTVHVESVEVQEGDFVKMICECVGYPASVMTYSFEPCLLTPNWPTCGIPIQPSLQDNTTKTVDEKISLIKQRIVIEFRPTTAGIVTCTAKNVVGQDSSKGEVRIMDQAAPLTVWGHNPNDLLVVGDTVELTCGASAYNFTENLAWYRNDELIYEDLRVRLTSQRQSYSYRKILRIVDLEFADSGIYECRVGDDRSDRDIQIEVLTATAPHIMNTNLEGNSLEYGLGEPVRLECDIKGIPLPTIEWFKDGVALTYSDADNNVKYPKAEENGKYLDFNTLRPVDEGHYKCVARNKVGEIAAETHLKIGDMVKPKYGLIATISSVVILIFIAVILCLCFRIRRNKRYLDELKAAGLENFEQGNPESFNPELNLDEQADLLPYDRNFEFPREKLKLGKQLGCGAFGVVVKGVAEGILPYEDQTTVAVKMVKKQTDNEVMRALISELKIMVHLGHHLNVVNLLGAVTKNIVKRDVMVIVEYCRFGNVQNFLLKHRPYFVDQIVRDTDTIDSEIMSNEMRWSKHSNYVYNSQGLKYLKLDFPPNKKLNNNYENDRSTDGVDNLGANMNSQGYVRHSGMQTNNGVDSCGTEATLISYGPDSVNQQNSVNADEPMWCSNYRSDYKGPARSVTTSDLVCWAFQVARGMDYLSSRKVLHGDLAARNILLSDDNVVKICDFGLAKSMYKTNNYKKKSESPLPFKWLALESISDSVFSTYSDIWAFGIVLWEFFSLGKVPYPGMNADESLFFKLRDGYRMDRPQYATQNLYDIMLSCWRINPETRPLFKELEKMLGTMLDDSVKDHYMDLNDPYLKMNMSQFQEGATDYLGMLGTPDQMAPAPPTYVNGNLQFIRELNEAENQPDYLKMSPRTGSVRYNAGSSKSPTRESLGYSTGGDSPTLQNNLDMDDSKGRTKKSGLPEERPMLATRESDSESEGSPDPKRAMNKSKFSEMNPLDDSYLNFRPNDAFSNPGYVSVKTVNEKA